MTKLSVCGVMTSVTRPNLLVDETPGGGGVIYDNLVTFGGT